MKRTRQNKTIRFLPAFFTLWLLASVTAAADGAAQPERERGNSGVLVAYFGRAGNTADTGVDTSGIGSIDVLTSASLIADGATRRGTTEQLARLICDKTAGDLYAIRTLEPYPADFNAVVAQARRERSENKLPALGGSAVDISHYTTVFIGYPVWGSTVPQAVRAFLSAYDFSGKTVIPFCTHDGYGAGNSFAAVRSLCPASAVPDGFALEASRVPSAREPLNRWLQSLFEQLPSAAAQKNETPLTITVGGVKLSGTLNGSPEAVRFAALLPQRVTMRRWDNREFYGPLPQTIPVTGTGKYTFENGEITYCPANNTVAVFFDKSVKPALGMAVYSIGTVTADISVLHTLTSTVSMVFSKAE